jgi:hypothetical protein
MRPTMHATNPDLDDFDESEIDDNPILNPGSK